MKRSAILVTPAMLARAGCNTVAGMGEDDACGAEAVGCGFCPLHGPLSRAGSLG